MEIFHEVGPKKTPTASFVLGVSRLDEAELGADAERLKKMMSRLEELDKEAGKKSSGFNQERDVLVAETAIQKGFTLITGDINLAKVTQEFGGCAMDLATVLRNR